MASAPEGAASRRPGGHAVSHTRVHCRFPRARLRVCHLVPARATGAGLRISTIGSRDTFQPSTAIELVEARGGSRLELELPCGYQTSSDITQSLTLVALLPILTFGDAIGFHLTHVLLFVEHSGKSSTSTCESKTRPIRPRPGSVQALPRLA